MSKTKMLRYVVVLLWWVPNAGLAQQTSPTAPGASPVGDELEKNSVEGQTDRSTADARTEVDALPPSERQTTPLKTPEQWLNAYDRARSALLAGNFREAAKAFEALAQNPQIAPSDRLRANEMAFLSSHWVENRLKLAREDEVSESHRRSRIRTIDELATLYIYSVLYGLGTGAWLAALTAPDNVAAIVLPALGLGALGAGAVALLDMGDLPYGAAHATVTGIQIGLGQGLLWVLWDLEHTRKEDEFGRKVAATLAWTTTTVGAVGGYLIGTMVDNTPGDASYVGSGALWGAALGGLASAGFTPDSLYRDDNFLLGAAIGLNIGIAASLLTASRVAPTVARCRFLDLGGLAGGLVFGGIYVSAANDDIETQPLAGISALGIATGLVSTWFMTDGLRETSDKDETASALPQLVLAPVDSGMMLNLSGTI